MRYTVVVCLSLLCTANAFVVPSPQTIKSSRIDLLPLPDDPADLPFSSLSLADVTGGLIDDTTAISALILSFVGAVGSFVAMGTKEEESKTTNNRDFTELNPTLRKSVETAQPQVTAKAKQMWMQRDRSPDPRSARLIPVNQVKALQEQQRQRQKAAAATVEMPPQPAAMKPQYSASSNPPMPANVPSVPANMPVTGIPANGMASAVPTQTAAPTTAEGMNGPYYYANMGSTNVAAPSQRVVERPPRAKKIRSSYKMSNWNPRQRVNMASSNSATGTYLANMTLMRPSNISGSKRSVSTTTTATTQEIPTTRTETTAFEDGKHENKPTGIEETQHNKPPAPANIPTTTVAFSRDLTQVSIDRQRISEAARKGYSYAMTKWTPGTNIRNVANSYLSHLQSKETTYDPIVEASPTVTPPEPAFMPDTSNPSNGSSPTKTDENGKSYSVSNWKPDQAAPATGSSYLSQMTSMSGTISSVPNASKVPTSFTTVSSSTTDQPSVSKGTSYGVSKWKPGSTVPETNAYFSQMKRKSPSAAINDETEETRPTDLVSPNSSAFSSNIDRPTVSKGSSFGVSKWTPETPVPETGSVYFSQMCSGISSSPTDRVEDPATMRTSSSDDPISHVESDVSAAKKESYAVSKLSPGSPASSSGASAFVQTQSESKSKLVAEEEKTAPPSQPLSTSYTFSTMPRSSTSKSYSMSKWKPGDKVKETGNTYLSNMGELVETTPPTSGTAPSTDSLSPAASGPTESRSKGSVTVPKSSYAPTKWKPGKTVASLVGNSQVPKMGSAKGSSRLPKSYSMTRWSPGNTVPERETTKPSGSDSSELTANAKSTSYSMSSWKPGQDVPSTGSSYLSELPSTRNDVYGTSSIEDGFENVQITPANSALPEFPGSADFAETINGEDENGVSMDEDSQWAVYESGYKNDSSRGNRDKKQMMTIS